MKEGPATEQLIALLLLGVVIFNFPFLAVLGGRIAGVPLLWVGLFVIWAAFIGLLVRVHRGRRDD